MAQPQKIGAIALASLVMNSQDDLFDKAFDKSVKDTIAS
jgi:hypothetical protein